MEPRISCIVCAFNEATRIGSTLDVISTHPEIDEVIVVDDGSTDDTASVVAKYTNVRLIRHSENLGKSKSIVSGVSVSKNDTLLFLDADLAGLTAENVHALLEPVRRGEVDMTMSLRKNSLLVYQLMNCDFVSGERVLPKDILISECDAISELPPFGFEVYVNRLVFERGLRTKVVRWDNVINPSKTSKMGLLSGWRSNARMLRDIFGVITPLELLQQNYFLSGFR